MFRDLCFNEKKKKYKEEKVCVRKVKEGYSGAGMAIQGLATDGGHDFLVVHFAFYNNPLNCIILFCYVRLFATPWTVARQAPPSLKFSRQEYWSGLPFPSQGIFLTQGSHRVSCTAGKLFTI